jgi:hypothetical protein
MRWRAALSVLVALALLPPVTVYAATQYVSGDTGVLVQHVRDVFADIGHGQWIDWSGHFALLQQVPAGVLVALQLPDEGVFRGLVVLNLLVLVAVTVLAYRRMRRRSEVVAILFVAVLLSGPFLWYGHASFSELLATALALAMVILLLDGAGPVWVVLTMLGASIAKDTSLPFVALLALGTAFDAAPAGARWYQRLRLPTIAAGAVLSAVVVGGFNYLQFRSVTSISNLDPKFIVPTLGIQARFFLAIWFSPNGGVVPFWPTFAAFMLIAVAAALAQARRIPDWRRRATALVPLGTAVVVLGGVSVGLSRWFAPLGWISWGPRLLLPWLPATAYLLGVAYAEQVEAFVTALRRHAIALLVPALLILASLPQYVILFRPTLWDSLFLPDAVCPRVPVIEEGATYYYRCTIYQLWTKHSVLIDPYHLHLGQTAFILAVTCCAAWLWFTVNGLLSARRRIPG